jgi:hypothetical protein
VREGDLKQQIEGAGDQVHDEPTPEPPAAAIESLDPPIGAYGSTQPSSSWSQPRGFHATAVAKVGASAKSDTPLGVG